MGLFSYFSQEFAGDILTKATRLTFVCHGATSATHAGAFPLDEALAPGETQRAAGFAGQLRHAHHFLTSPALRARQTAEALGLEATVDAAMADMDYGRWAGRPLSDIHASDPDNAGNWMADPDSAPHGGESFNDLLQRVSDWMEAHLDDGGHTIVVSHALVVRAAILYTLQAPVSAFWRIDVEPLSFTELRSDGRRWMLRVCANLPSPIEGNTT
ncbi:Broad specificity phosphatase PhoE [Phyllobacterium sp. OV277]|nr:Broad specificity phosphatase PhoE [Phyllobacterium sp. OV277]